ncbi:MAG: Fic family protein [Gemmatimonadota bacterium]|nr:Fic family protein [Gemmatimonadota bacterium]
MDRGAGGQIKVPVSVKNPATRDRYIVNALIEESITSSQLEGAATTRRVAENMLRSERAPRNRSEWMILNNYQAMLFVQEEVGKPLTVEMLLELHEIVTRNTLDDPDDAGRFRRSDDIVIEDRRGNILHHPPKATELEARVRMMCDFANAKSDKPFVHPLVRAVALHFWLAYDHPFVDGNGRTARALFYWAMLSEGYWLTEFLSISKILRKAPAKYGDSFLRTETDDNDLTYFLLYQLEVLQRALDELRDYLSKEMERTSEVENRLQGEDLNHRQLALLEHALKNPRQEYTFGSHGMSHKVVYQTARTDLLELEKRGFLLRKKRGRAFVFTPAPDLESRLGNPAERKNS